MVLLSKLIWLAGVIGWFLIRLPHQRRSKRTRVSKSARTPTEIASLFVSGMSLGPIPALIAFTDLADFADREQSWVWVLIGTALFVAALVLFRLTHKALGRNWSVSLDLREDHKLVTDGVYAFARHPMYSAFWLWAIAQAFLLPNWIAGLIAIFGFGQLYFQRVFKEERMMESAFGQGYRDYCKETGRLFPRLMRAN